MSTVETTGTSHQDGGLPGLLGGLIWGVVGLILTLAAWAGLGAYHASTAPNNPEQYVDQQLEAQIQLVDNALSSAQFGSEPMVEAVLWVFYAGHGVPIQFDLGDRTESIQFLEFWAAIPDASETMYLAVPAVVLGLCGLILARRAGANDLAQGAIGGAFVVIGYGGLFCLSLAFATVESADGLVSIGPAMSDAVLRGLGYPIVAGAIGGALAGLGES